MKSNNTTPKVEPARHWINGEWIGSSVLANSVSPSTGEALGQYSAGGRTEAAAAIAAARKAFDNGTWAHDPQLRSQALFELANRFDERAEAIALMLSREMGKALRDSTWEATLSPSTHALRIVYSGVFDRFPTAKLVLGHLGESLPFLAWRIQHGINFSPNGRSTKKRLIDYFADNIWVTTSGNFNTQALHCTMLTMGADRILFAADYP